MKQVSIWGVHYLRAWIGNIRRRRSGLQFTAEPEPDQKNDGHVLLIKATHVDVASCARAIDGVRKITRGANGIWNVAADLDVTGAVARRIVTSGGSLKLLVNVKPGSESAFASFAAKHEAGVLEEEVDQRV